jgi:hypothetical protein
MRPENPITAAALLEQLPSLSGADSVQGVALNTWSLVFANAPTIELEFDEARAQLVLSADLGRPIASEEVGTHLLLLQMNNLWRETCGLWMSLKPGNGHVIQRYAVFMTGLEPERLAGIVRNFTADARSWCTLIATIPEANSAPLAQMSQSNRV